MWKLINLKFDDECNSCGVKLPKGTRAVWQGKGRVICLDCVGEEDHGRDGFTPRVRTFTTSGGTFTKCNCEDYPCCGH